MSIQIIQEINPEMDTENYFLNFFIYNIFKNIFIIYFLIFIYDKTIIFKNYLKDCFFKLKGKINNFIEQQTQKYSTKITDLVLERLVYDQKYRKLFKHTISSYTIDIINFEDLKNKKQIPKDDNNNEKEAEQFRKYKETYAKKIFQLYFDENFNELFKFDIPTYFINIIHKDINFFRITNMAKYVNNNFDILIFEDKNSDSSKLKMINLLKRFT